MKNFGAQLRSTEVGFIEYNSDIMVIKRKIHSVENIIQNFIRDGLHYMSALYEELKECPNSLKHRESDSSKYCQTGLGDGL